MFESVDTKMVNLEHRYRYEQSSQRYTRERVDQHKHEQAPYSCNSNATEIAKLHQH